MRRSLWPCKRTRLGSTFYHCPNLDRERMHRALQLLQATRTIKVARGTSGLATGRSLTRAKEEEEHMEKGKAKVASLCCPSFCWDVTTPTWIHMGGACASIISWGNAARHPTEVSAHAVGICALAVDAMPRIPRKIMMERRNDMAQVASARWLKLVWA